MSVTVPALPAVMQASKDQADAIKSLPPWFTILGPILRAHALQAMQRAALPEEAEIEEPDAEDDVVALELLQAAEAAGWQREAWCKDARNEVVGLIRAEPDEEDLHQEAVALYTNLPPIQANVFLSTLKKVNKDLTKGAIRDAAKALKQEASGKQETEDLTHDDMALKYIEAKGSDNLVYDRGELWLYDAANLIWEPRTEATLQELGQMFPGEALARRASDFKGIMDRIRSNTTREGFFDNAPVGLATPRSFYRVSAGGIACEPLQREHRCRFKISVDPVKGDMPLLMDVLKDAVGDYHFNAQMEQLFEMLGLALIGEMHKLQRVLFIKGAPNNFKSRLLSTVAGLFPKDARAAVRMTDFHVDTKMAKVLRAAINVAPEATEEHPIVGDTFKAAVGGDEISANLKYKDTFFATVTAALMMAGNTFPVMTEYSDATFRRWSIIVWPNGKDENEVDTSLPQRIEQEELPQLVFWCLEAAKKYFERGCKPNLSPAHFEALDEWKTIRDSVSAYRHSGHFVDRKPNERGTAPVPKPGLWDNYCRWCAQEGRKHLGKKNFLDRFSKLPGVQPGRNQYGETFNGIAYATGAENASINLN